MNPPPDPSVDSLPVLEPASDSLYSLEVFAEISGVSLERIQYYVEHRLILPVDDSRNEACQFDVQTLRTLRRIEHLRVTCGINTAGLRLVNELLGEIDRLQTKLRRRPPAL